MDLPLAFTYRKNDGYLNFNAISVYKMYIDFSIKILERHFLNDKQILTRLFQIILTLEGLVIIKAHTYLKVQSRKLYNKKYMIASTQITNTEICAFIALNLRVLDFKLLSRKDLFINRKDNRNC